MSDGELRVFSPGDLDAPPSVYPWSLEAAADAVEEARAAQPAWEATPLEDRLGLLQRLKGRFTAHEEEFAKLLGIEVGKPLWEGRQEAQLLANKIDSTLGEGLRLVQAHKPEGVDGEWRFRPHGVLAVIGPFNFPVHLPNGHVIPALATGNCVVFKPSELTPRLGDLYALCAKEAGFPPGVLQVVHGERRVGEFLSAGAAVDGVLFTGSVGVGVAIAQANAARPGKILALELGGKNAAVVFADADLDRAAYQIAFGAYVTAGQRCSSTSRCLAQRRIVEKLQQRLKKLAEGLAVGAYDDPKTFMGPLISRQAVERFTEVLETAGAEPIVPTGEARVPGKRGHYRRPSLHRVRSARRDSRYERDELFGPDLALYAFADEDEAVALANSTQFGLCASVYTESRERFDRVAARLRAGVINWNSPTVGASGKLPFGGISDSGNHRPAGIFSSLYCTWPVALSYGATGPTRDKPVPGL